MVKLSEFHSYVSDNQSKLLDMVFVCLLRKCQK